MHTSFEGGDTTESPSRTPSATKLVNFLALKISGGIVVEIAEFA